MNKRELIETIDNLQYTLSWNIPRINKEIVIDLINQLDEPQPLKLKDIISRMKQLFPLSRAEWIDEILKEFGEDYGSMKYREGYEQGKFDGEWVGNQLKDADKIRQELNKVALPNFMDDWIFKCQLLNDFSLSDALNSKIINLYAKKSESVKKWLDDKNNQELFARAWLDGYEVGEEKRYKVVMPNIASTGGVLTRIKHDDNWIWIDTLGTIVEGRTHTRKELEDAGFGEVFDSPLFEVEEVTE